MILYTHYALDIDAASTLALACMITGSQEIRYIRADVTKKEFLALHNSKEEYLILDIDCEGLGIKGRKVIRYDGAAFVLSAFSSYLERQDDKYKQTFLWLANYIDVVDAKLPASKELPENSWLTIFLALKRISRTDEELFKVWLQIITGHHQNYLATFVAQEEAKQANWSHSNIAYIKSPKEHSTIKFLMHQGADFVIYEDGNNMGIVISDNVSRAVAPELGRALPGWFVHASGFLVAWGTKKAQKEVPSGFKLKEIADIINGVYNE